MAVMRRYALCFYVFCMFLWVWQASGSDPADHGGATEESSDVPGTSSSNESEGGSGHGAPITTLPIVTWKWHHVEAPYIVMLWILVCWLCKLGESRPH
ncbi:unnamed protein product [Knipowitschia caucasica]